MEENISSIEHTTQQQGVEQDTKHDNSILPGRQESVYNFECRDVRNLRQYVQNFERTIGRVNENQLLQLKNKYRYYLSKSQKLQQTRNILQQRYNSIGDIIENSLPVMEVKKSIQFIITMTQFTNTKLQQLTKTINKMQDQKLIYNDKISNLKTELKKQKNIFFQHQRVLINMRNTFEIQKKVIKKQNASSIFKSIINTKISRNKMKIGGGKIYGDNSLGNFSVMNNRNSNHYKEIISDGKFQEIYRQGKQSSDKMMYNYLRNTTEEEDTTNTQAKSYEKVVMNSLLGETSKLNVTQMTKSTKLARPTPTETKNKFILSELENSDKRKKDFIKQLGRNTKKNSKLLVTNSFFMAKNNLNEISTNVSNTNWQSNQRYKFSLGGEQVLQMKEKVGKINGRKRWQQLLVKQEQVDEGKNEGSQKQLFMKLEVNDIIKIIIEKDRIGEFLGLFQNYHGYQLCQQE